MQDLQLALVSLLERQTSVRDLMELRWVWPIAESLHFIGLCLLIGAIGTFDLRLLGVGRSVPIAAVHRLVPWGILGFAINAGTGALFVTSYPDQYIYNPAFHLKLLFLAIAGVNATLFYLTSFRRVFGAAATCDAPAAARVIAAISLSAWLAVIVCGRLLTFHRPNPCLGDEATVLLSCAPDE